MGNGHRFKSINQEEKEKKQDLKEIKQFSKKVRIEGRARSDIPCSPLCSGFIRVPWTTSSGGACQKTPFCLQFQLILYRAKKKLDLVFGDPQIVGLADDLTLAFTKPY